MIPSFKGFYFNYKGLTYLVWVVPLKNWMFKAQVIANFVCLQEVKRAGTPLLINLKKLGDHFNWYITSHQEGRGGIATGINDKLRNLISNMVVTSHFLSLMLKNPFSFSLVCVYAPCNFEYRAKL